MSMKNQGQKSWYKDYDIFLSDSDMEIRGGKKSDLCTKSEQASEPDFIDSFMNSDIQFQHKSSRIEEPDQNSLQIDQGLKKSQKLGYPQKKKQIKKGQTKQSIPSKSLRSRKRKGKKNYLQRLVHGYWTKNMLQFPKNHHFDAIIDGYGVKIFEEQPYLIEINNKNGISTEDYQYMYNIQKLRNIWQKFFSKKILYRELMNSRMNQNSRLIYLKFLHKFENAFRTKYFPRINQQSINVLN